MESKPELRRRMKGVCSAVVDVESRSAVLWDRLASTEAYRAAATVMAFVSMPGEPQTGPLLERIVTDGKRLVLPRIVGDRLEAALRGERLVPGSLRIPAPTGDAVEPRTIDLVVVPGVAFTERGERLGHGKAYYDRFLPTTSAVTIGVCFAEQIVGSLPLEPHDRLLDNVLAC